MCLTNTLTQIGISVSRAFFQTWMMFVHTNSSYMPTGYYFAVFVEFLDYSFINTHTVEGW